jgi:hypothetical protein
MVAMRCPGSLHRPHGTKLYAMVGNAAVPSCRHDTSQLWSVIPSRGVARCANRPGPRRRVPTRRANSSRLMTPCSSTARPGLPISASRMCSACAGGEGDVATKHDRYADTGPWSGPVSAHRRTRIGCAARLGSRCRARARVAPYPRCRLLFPPWSSLSDVATSSRAFPLPKHRRRSPPSPDGHHHRSDNNGDRHRSFTSRRDGLAEVQRSTSPSGGLRGRLISEARSWNEVVRDGGHRWLSFGTDSQRAKARGSMSAANRRAMVVDVQLLAQPAVYLVSRERRRP